MKIAIVRLSALGDIIQTAICLQFIKKFKQDTQIHWFVDERFKELLEDHPLIDKVYALPLKDKKILKVLKILHRARKNEYDLVVDFQGLVKSALVSRALSVNNFGFDKYSLKESLAANFYNQKFYSNYDENVFLRYLNLISYVFNESFELDDLRLKEPIFKAKEGIKQTLVQRLALKKDDKNILIHVGSSVENKIYPKERLAILINLILKHYEQARIFLAWGNDKELKFSKDLLASCVASQRLEILQKLSLQELIAMTKLSSLVIGNDSGPTHLAFAMNKPSITIFGATPSGRNAFATPINRVIDSGKKILHAKHLDKSDFCIQNVDEDKIFELTKELLG
ncbi:lipopolysaccharide heptosyltransferase I [Campylobacter sp. MIT 99-7217]|uniref:lipopolysaccharide heptosyltransferase I n=1 Tax=Campylobacter sp. MIT 99-7217 TaxID=535091 RepID=UPI001158C2AE|nr:lipopolysaccharide heptosyltransferase I [Campylobacter sp. MIT 99-7217]TQR33754.1 lipopolysaccharide heptosyltransferase I [Campylobacter sp. MIT 99-7217]